MENVTVTDLILYISKKTTVKTRVKLDDTKQTDELDTKLAIVQFQRHVVPYYREKLSKGNNLAITIV